MEKYEGKMLTQKPICTELLRIRLKNHVVVNTFEYTSLLTLWACMLMPTKKMNSDMKRLQHRFLCIVVLVLWISLKNQKVKMHMDRQMMEITMPSWVILVRML